MDRFIILIVLLLLGALFGLWARNRKPDPPTSPSYRAPSQLIPDEFDISKHALVTFLSSKCESCEAVDKLVTARESNELDIRKVLVEQNEEVVERYKIDGVPTTLLVSGEGEVISAFFGPLNPEELDAELAEI